MAVGIKLIGKDITTLGESGRAYALAFTLVDRGRDSDVEVPARFPQTQELTSAMIGITDYGAMYINSESLPADFTGDITVTAVTLDDGTEYTGTFSYDDIGDLVVGDLLEEEGGGD